MKVIKDVRFTAGILPSPFSILRQKVFRFLKAREPESHCLRMEKGKGRMLEFKRALCL